MPFGSAQGQPFEFAQGPPFGPSTTSGYPFAQGQQNGNNRKIISAGILGRDSIFYQFINQKIKYYDKYFRNRSCKKCGQL